MMVFGFLECLYYHYYAVTIGMHKSRHAVLPSVAYNVNLYKYNYDHLVVFNEH